MNRGKRSYAPLSVVGLELEYAIVDTELAPQCLVEEAFHVLNGRPTSDVTRDGVGFSNELAAHVFEEKMLRPHGDLRTAEQRLVDGLRVFRSVLNHEFGARLLPTGMHPLMRPEHTRLWRRGGRSIYRTYANLFDTTQHGWVNVQSCHVNLPFGRNEQDVIRLYNAVACLLPYLPAITASSPLVEGRVGPYLDNRLAFYARNQRRIPCITGGIVPEFIRSVREYRTRVLGPIYDALRAVPGGHVLCHEWVNSRGAILRFARRALEIRVLDVQECVRMDVAVAAFTRAVLRYLVDAIEAGEVPLPAHGMLVADLESVIAGGRGARVQAKHLTARGRAGAVLDALLEHARAYADEADAEYIDLVARRLEHGSLAERIIARLRGAGSRKITATRVRDVYEELVTCLEANRPWEG